MAKYVVQIKRNCLQKRLIYCFIRRNEKQSSSNTSFYFSRRYHDDVLQQWRWRWRRRRRVRGFATPADTVLERGDAAGRERRHLPQRARGGCLARAQHSRPQTEGVRAERRHTLIPADQLRHPQQRLRLLNNNKINK